MGKCNVKSLPFDSYIFLNYKRQLLSASFPRPQAFYMFIIVVLLLHYC